MKNKFIISILIFLVLINLYSYVSATYDIPSELVITNNDLTPFAQEFYDTYTDRFNNNNFTKFFAFYTYETDVGYVLNLICAPNDTSFHVTGNQLYGSGAYRFAKTTSITTFWASPSVEFTYIKNSYENGYFYTTFDFSLTYKGTTFDFTTANNPMNITIIDSNGNDYVNIQNGGSSQISYFEPTLMLDDYNFKKSFKFNFQIPYIKEDTKYYTFLKSYTRNNYNSVSADFVILTISTPDDYDYSNYTNYLYYDEDKQKLFLPAGCNIQCYSASGNNGETLTCTEISNGSSILSHYNWGIALGIALSNIGEYDFVGDYKYNDLIPTDFNISTKFISPLVNQIIKGLSLRFGSTLMSVNNISDWISAFNTYEGQGLNKEDFYKQFYKMALYYGFADNSTDNSNLIEYDVWSNWNNFAFGNYKIQCYQSSKYDDSFNSNYYKLFKSTFVYSQENRVTQVNDNFYRLSYTDNVDVSSMLPQGINLDYLTSPFYEHNYNSSSGGYVTYNIDNIITGDNFINYNQDESPLRDVTPDFYSYTGDTDNSSITNNYNTTQIDNTETNNLLKRIYVKLLDIEGAIVSIAVRSIYNIENIGDTLRHLSDNLFMFPDDEFEELFANVTTQVNEHLGFVTAPFDFTFFILNSIAQLNSNELIYFDLPETEYMGQVLIPQAHFSFTDMFNDNNGNNVWNYLHQICYMATDLMLVVICFNYAKKLYVAIFKPESHTIDTGDNEE